MKVRIIEGIKGLKGALKWKGMIILSLVAVVEELLDRIVRGMHGAKVLLIEAQDLGGTCVNLGCVPKKSCGKRRRCVK